MALTPLNLRGADGDDGASATVGVGTVTTGAPGSSASVVNVGSPSAAVLNFTIPRGAPGVGGGISAPVEWAPGSSYDVGELVTYDGDVWQLVTAEAGNGYTTGVEVVRYEQGDYVNLTGQRSPTAEFLAARATGDVVVAIIEGISTSWDSVATANLTAIPSASVSYNTGANGRLGVRFDYSTSIGTTPSVTLAGGEIRLTWLLVRGSDGVPRFAASQGYSIPDPVTVSNVGAPTVSPEPTAAYVLMAGVRYKSSGGIALTRMAPPLFGRRFGASGLVRGLYVDPPQFGKWIGGVAGIPRTPSLGNYTLIWGGDDASNAELTSAGQLGAMVMFAAASSALPTFDRTAWRRVSGPSHSITYDLADFVEAESITVPEEDRAYHVVLDDKLAGTWFQFELKLPDPADMGTRHQVRVTFEMQSRFRRVATFPLLRRRVTVGEDLTLSLTPGGTLLRGDVVEPGPDPGSVTTIDYEWDPAVLAWYIAGYSGDAMVRRHKFLATRYPYVEYGIPVYFSPELSGSEPAVASIASAQASEATTGIGLVPMWLRRLMARAGVWIDVCLLEIAEGIANRRVVDSSGLNGVFWSSRGSVSALARDNGGESSLPGFTILHELGHALSDVYYVTADRLAQDGDLPTEWRVWLYDAPGGRLHDDAVVNTLWSAIQSEGAVSSYLKGARSEWFAQAMAVYWSSLNPSLNTTAWNGARTRLVGAQTSVYDDFVARLQELRIAP